jgi:hypothetical protein
MKNPMKILLNWAICVAVCLFMAARAGAAVTNATWIFPATTTPGPSQPIAANQSSYSVNDNLGWTAASGSLYLSFIARPGYTTALEFSYSGNHPDYLNGSILTLTFTISGVPVGHGLTDFQLSYDTRWNKAANTVTETWSYSVNGSAYVNFDTAAATGNVWQTETIQLSGVTLNNSDTLTLRSTLSGAAGNNGALDFDNFEMTSNIVPEPSALALVALTLSMAWIGFKFRSKTTPVISSPAPATVSRSRRGKTRKTRGH